MFSVHVCDSTKETENSSKEVGCKHAFTNPTRNFYIKLVS